jgi:hypothetical protein
MAKPVWWTCGCGQKMQTFGGGTPKCSKCGKDAPWLRQVPVGQGSLFGNYILDSLGIEKG